MNEVYSNTLAIGDLHLAEERKLEWSDVTVASGRKDALRLLLKFSSGMARSGRLVAVMGPSGSGKTTLLKALSGTVDKKLSTYGTVTFNGKVTDKEFGDSIAFLPQHDIFVGWQSVKESTSSMIAGRKRGVNKEKIEEEIARFCEIFALEHLQNRKVGNLSGGERKRLLIANTLLSGAPVSFLDEPTTGLDSHLALEMVENLKRYAVDNKSIVIITVHQPSQAVTNMIDDLVYLFEGDSFYSGPMSKFDEHLSKLGLNAPSNLLTTEYVFMLGSHRDIRFAGTEERSKFLGTMSVSSNSRGLIAVKGTLKSHRFPKFAFSSRVFASCFVKQIMKIFRRNFITLRLLLPIFSIFIALWLILRRKCPLHSRRIPPNSYLTNNNLVAVVYNPGFSESDLMKAGSFLCKGSRVTKEEAINIVKSLVTLGPSDYAALANIIRELNGPIKEYANRFGLVQMHLTFWDVPFFMSTVSLLDIFSVTLTVAALVVIPFAISLSFSPDLVIINDVYFGSYSSFELFLSAYLSFVLLILVMSAALYIMAIPLLLQNSCALRSMRVILISFGIVLISAGPLGLVAAYFNEKICEIISIVAMIAGSINDLKSSVEIFGTIFSWCFNVIANFLLAINPFSLFISYAHFYGNSNDKRYVKRRDEFISLVERLYINDLGEYTSRIKNYTGDRIGGMDIINKEMNRYLINNPTSKSDLLGTDVLGPMEIHIKNVLTEKVSTMRLDGKQIYSIVRYFVSERNNGTFGNNKNDPAERAAFCIFNELMQLYINSYVRLTKYNVVGRILHLLNDNNILGRQKYSLTKNMIIPIVSSIIALVLLGVKFAYKSSTYRRFRLTRQNYSI